MVANENIMSTVILTLVPEADEEKLSKQSLPDNELRQKEAEV